MEFTIEFEREDDGEDTILGAGVFRSKATGGKKHAKSTDGRKFLMRLNAVLRKLGFIEQRCKMLRVMLGWFRATSIDIFRRKMRSLQALSSVIVLTWLLILHVCRAPPS